MSEDEWWHLNRMPKASRFLWINRKYPQPENPLRLLNAVPRPTAAGHLACESAGPEDAGWLLQSGPAREVEAFNINVEPLPERLPVDPGREAASRPGGVGPTLGGETRQVEMPSLADRLRAVLLVPLEAVLPGEGSILEWPSALKEYQVDGVRALIERDRMLLADDMGLGKTIQAIAAFRILCAQRRAERSLLIVPAGIIDQWRREIALWAPELRVMVVRGPAQDRAWQWITDAHVTLVSYETFRADFTTSSQVGQRIWDVVILDEAQRIKNRDAEISQQVKRLRRLRSWALTGTPLENKLDDLASILEFVDHNADGTSKTYAPNKALLERHRELQLRRRKADVLTELPPKQIINVQIPLLPRQQESYDRAEREGVIQLRERGATIRVEHILELITRLKQLCNLDPVTGESAKLADVRERLRVLSEEGHRALLFSQYTDDTFGAQAIARYLSEFRPLTYTGSLSSSERDLTVQRFKRDETHRALILSLRAGGVGLNLQEASYVFHIDRWWNPAVERQAEDRTHRMGQVYPVTVLKYTCLGTIEERIDRILSEKQQLFDEVVDDISFDVASRLSREDLFGLFGLQPPTSAADDARPKKRTGLELEARCAAILESRGWQVQRTPRTRDGGIDLIGTRTDEVGLEERLFVQCKDYARPVGVEVVRELLGALPTDGGARPVIAAPSGLTPDAARLAHDRGVTVWDEATLVRLEG